MNPYSFGFLKARVSIGQVLSAYGLDSRLKTMSASTLIDGLGITLTDGLFTMTVSSGGVRKYLFKEKGL